MCFFFAMCVLRRMRHSLRTARSTVYMSGMVALGISIAFTLENASDFERFCLRGLQHVRFCHLFACNPLRARCCSAFVNHNLKPLGASGFAFFVSHLNGRLSGGHRASGLPCAAVRWMRAYNTGAWRGSLRSHTLGRCHVISLSSAAVPRAAAARVVLLLVYAGNYDGFSCFSRQHIQQCGACAIIAEVCVGGAAV